MEKEEIYVFKAALKYRKRLWRRIEIESDQTLGDLDYIMRVVFNHDIGDHLSEFYSGQIWQSEGFGEIDPDGGGSGANKQLNQLGLSKGDKIEYIYDFGDDIQHVITLEKVVEREKNVEYPRLVSKNKPKYRYCETCKKQGKKTVATWICIECSDLTFKETQIAS